MAVAITKMAKTKSQKISIIQQIIKDYKVNKFIILMMIPVLIFYVVFYYLPMYGIVIAFQDYRPAKGFFSNDWVGFKHFIDFFRSFYAWRVIRNTLVLSVLQLVFAFPAPIILALLMNELKSVNYKRVVQTLTYVPHFISYVVICGMVVVFTSKDGAINNMIAAFGGDRTNLLLDPKNFRTIFVSLFIWQNAGWQSIIYMASMASIDTEQYEAAYIDGANRWKQFLHVTLPGLAPTIVVLFILSLGKVMNEGPEKIILLYNPNTYETADTIASFVYRKGLEELNFSYSAAVGLFNTVINFILLFSTNMLSKKVNGVSLW